MCLNCLLLPLFSRLVCGASGRRQRGQRLTNSSSTFSPDLAEVSRKTGMRCASAKLCASAHSTWRLPGSFACALKKTKIGVVSPLFVNVLLTRAPERVVARSRSRRLSATLGVVCFLPSLRGRSERGEVEFGGAERCTAVALAHHAQLRVPARDVRPRLRVRRVVAQNRARRAAVVHRPASITPLHGKRQSLSLSRGSIRGIPRLSRPIVILSLSRDAQARVPKSARARPRRGRDARVEAAEALLSRLRSSSSSFCHVKRRALLFFSRPLSPRSDTALGESAFAPLSLSL